MRKFLFALICFFAIGAVVGQTDPQPRDLDWWIEAHEQFRANTANNSDIPIIFYGDSITVRWFDEGRTVFDQYYAPLGAVNYAMNEDRAQNVHWRIINGEVEGLSPKVVVVNIGSNNVGFRDGSPQSIAKGIASVVLRLRERLPTTKIILLSILPRTGVQILEDIVLINTIAQGLHDGEDVFFLDMFDRFRSDVWGEVPTELFDAEVFGGGTHLTEAGFQLWADIMNPLLNRLIQD